MRGVEQMNLDSAQNDGEWEVFQRKPKNKAESIGARPRGSQNSNPQLWGGGMRGNAGLGRGTGNAWANQSNESRMRTGRGNPRPQMVNNNNAKVEEDNDDIDDDSVGGDAFDASDDELLIDEINSDSSKSHETRKKNRWFKKLFETLDGLRIEEINDPEKRWRCPVCQGAPGNTDWYCGLHLLVTHAKMMKKARRVKLHRELAELLDEELLRQDTLVVPASKAYGKWRGLKYDEKDHEIIWPPSLKDGEKDHEIV
ncbi:hypothetical protein GQ457_18G001100 [Hibiscus cannabinus]